MKKLIKDTYLQVRLSQNQKTAIQKAAKAEGKDISKWVIEKLLTNHRESFSQLCKQIERSNEQNQSFALAELNDFFSNLSSREFTEVTINKPEIALPPTKANILAAMIEHCAMQKKTSPPLWLNDISPLSEPIYASELKSLRLHLLLNSPLAFRKRNIFVDSTIGQRV